jgi:hypothetical protein
MAKSELTTIWLYFARRDKTSVDVLTVLRGREQLPVRITDLSILDLPSSWLAEIQKLVKERKMEWELWAETAPTWDELRERLKKRGYSNLPLNGQPLFYRTSFLTPPRLNVNRLPEVKKMVQRSQS